MLRKCFSLLLALAFVFLPLLPMDAMAAVKSTDVEIEVETNDDPVIKTWVSDTGETLTAIITRACDVEVVKVNENENGKSMMIVTSDPYSPVVTPRGYDEYEVSDFYNVRVSGFPGQVIYEYRIYVKGIVSKVDSSRRITSVTFSHISGDTCTTSSSISGYTAVATFNHAVHGSFSVYISLGSGGAFTFT